MHTPFPKPTNADEARALARHYVACHLAKSDTMEGAQAAMRGGMCGPGIPGYEMWTGKIRVPCVGAPSWEFQFDELAKEIKSNN